MKILLNFLLCFLLVSPVLAETVQLIGTTVTFDAYIDSANATTNYGVNEQLRWWPSGGLKTWLKFDISSLTGTTINSAICSVYVHYASNSNNSGNYFKVNGVLKNVVEDQVTWNNYSTGNAWTTAGCKSFGNDFVTQAQDSFDIGPGGLGPGWIVFDFNDETDGSDDMTQGWVDETFPNYGVIMWYWGLGDMSARSSEYATEKPRLFIDYSPPPPPPPKYLLLKKP